jgi:hypothetical protein
MEEKSTKMTFELNDLSYKDLLITYKEISNFIDYLDKLKKEMELEVGDKTS